MPTAFENARVLAALGHTRDALAALDALLREQPEHVSALLLRAELHLEAREGEAALALHERVVRLAPESAEAWNGLARCLHALARHDEALRAAEHARALLPKGDNDRHASAVDLTLVWCLRELRRYKEALAVAEQGLERCPDGILAQCAEEIEDELAEAEKERC